MTELPLNPPDDPRPITVGRWAAAHPEVADSELAKMAGVSAARLKICRRVAASLHDDVLWLVEQHAINFQVAQALARLTSHDEQLTIAAGLVHEAQVAKATVSTSQVRHIIAERIRRPDEPILTVTSDTAGIRFHSKPGIMHMPENLPALYAAAWRWRDPSISEFIAKAPERLANLTNTLGNLTAKGSTDQPDGLHVSVAISIAPSD